MNIFIERTPSQFKHIDFAKEYDCTGSPDRPDILLCTYHIDKYNRLNGEFIRYDRYGNIIEQGNYENNKKSGVWKTYYSSGNIEEECTYQDGKRHGLCKRYYSQNILAEEITFQNGEINGPYRDYNLTGSLSKEGYRVCNGKAGEWTWYDDSGKVIKKSPYDISQKETVVYPIPVSQSNKKSVPKSPKIKYKPLEFLGAIASLTQCETRPPLLRPINIDNYRIKTGRFLQELNRRKMSRVRA